jgi:hypothetical protein
MTATNYRPAENKPTKTLVNYNTVRPPELRLLHETLTESVSGTVNLSRLERQFTHDDADHLENCLRFLWALDFLERPDDRVIEPINQDVFPSLSFEAKLLHHLKRQERPQDHLARTQEVAFGEAAQTLDRDLLETYLERTLGYINWNSTKVNMWYNLYQGIGVIDFIDTRELVLSPSRALVYELLDAFVDLEGSNEFGEAVAWIERHFMSVLEDRPGTPRLHRGVTDTLQNLIDDGVVSVRGMADARNEVQLPATHSRVEEPAIKEFELHDAPMADRASYRHPVDRFREVSR